MTAPHIEMEVKISLSAEALEGVFNTLSKGQDVRQKHLLRDYYDTPELTLNKRKVALRLEKSDKGGYIQMLKSAQDTAPHQALVRHEWEVFVAENKPDVGVYMDTGAHQLLSGITNKDLRHIFSSDLTRRAFDVENEDGQVEVAFDLGKIRAFSAKGEVSCDFAEIEVELISGDPSAIQRVISDVLKTEPTAKISDVSKASRGFALYLRD